MPPYEKFPAERVYKLAVKALNDQFSVWFRGTECTECQAFSSVVRIGSSRSLTRKRVLPPPLFNPGGDTLVYGRAGGGSQFGGGEGG
jgi:hypothetical protein